MKFLVDAQLPPALADWLASQGHEADHVSAVLSLNALDADIWALAMQRAAVIVTKDRDFAIWAAARRQGPQVVWVRMGNATTAALIAWLEPRWTAIENALRDGTHLVEIRS